MEWVVRYGVGGVVPLPWPAEASAECLLFGHLQALHVLLWHGICGYWGGLASSPSPPSAAEATCSSPWEACRAEMHISNELLKIEPELAVAPFVAGFGLIQDDSAGVPGAQWQRFYNTLHGQLARAGVDGCKVDGQAALARLAPPVRVLEESRAMQSGLPSLHCMCHGGGLLWTYDRAALARASDDFW